MAKAMKQQKAKARMGKAMKQQKAMQQQKAKAKGMKQPKWWRWSPQENSQYYRLKSLNKANTILETEAKPGLWAALEAIETVQYQEGTDGAKVLHKVRESFITAQKIIEQEVKQPLILRALAESTSRSAQHILRTAKKAKKA